MASVCSDVSPARLVERAEAPVGPMLLKLQERGHGSERERMGQVILYLLVIVMSYSLACCRACEERMTEENAAGRKEGWRPLSPKREGEEGEKGGRGRRGSKERRERRERKEGEEGEEGEERRGEEGQEGEGTGGRFRRERGIKWGPPPLSHQHPIYHFLFPHLIPLFPIRSLPPGADERGEGRRGSEGARRRGRESGGRGERGERGER
jgi:hypothetical protein